LYRRVIAEAPDHFLALHGLGVIECQRQNFAAGLQLIGRALKANPKDASAHLNFGNALRVLKRQEEAVASYDRALALKPDYAEAFYYRGFALLDLGRYAEALAACDRALALRPEFVDALINRGLALSGLERPEESLATYDRALALKPDSAEAHYNRGNVLLQLARHEDALASFDRALAVRPGYVEALNNRGNALRDLKRHEQALASYDRALVSRPGYAEALINRGNTLIVLKRHDEALASYDRALASNPDFADALYHRGMALLDLKRHDEAAREFERLLSVSPDYGYTKGNVLFAHLHCCDWTGYDKTVESIVKDVVAGKRASDPFIFLSVSGSPGDQLRCAQIYNRDKYPPAKRALWQGERYRHDRIRLAYLSADFRSHAVAYLIAELFEAHDKSRFETTAISIGPDSKDDMRKRLERSFDRFVDVRNKSDRDAALAVKELGIDIAVDLQGYTTYCRAGILAFRPAPIQVNYLGYPGTMGAPYIDYILADRTVIPEDQQGLYAEKVAYLPDAYQPNDSKRRIGERTPTRAEAGLPETGFVFCSFNNNYKIAPAVFDVWMRLLRAVEGSVLWLVATNAAASRNLRREAQQRGVAPERLVFAPHMPLEDHLARHRLADIFLDTLPYNAHTTASDALWAGLPVVTCLGSGFAGRVAGSLLDAVGLRELITDNLADYEALALKLARDKDRLAATTAELARNRQSFPLFDTDRFRRHIESAYETMWERCQRGEPAAGFAVAPR